MQEFEDLIAKGGFLEHAKFGSNRYGTSKTMIEEMGQKGKLVILDIEMEVCRRRRAMLLYEVVCHMLGRG